MNQYEVRRYKSGQVFVLQDATPDERGLVTIIEVARHPVRFGVPASEWKRAELVADVRLA